MTTTSSDTPTESERVPGQSWKRWLLRAGVLLLIVVAVIDAARLGMEFRRWMWETTAPIRMTADIDRDFYWGREAATEGYANQYDKMQLEQPGDLNWLDQPPLRLGVMTIWARWAMLHHPQVRQWRPEISNLKSQISDPTCEFASPLLGFNTGMEALGALAAFLLTRFWARRGYRRSAGALGSPPEFFDGWIPGLIAAAILWFNPAIVLSAYGWPAGDLWIIPMFLLAAFLASTDWWFTAGVVIGIGAMLKGQQLLSVPVFLIWAIIIGRPISAMRLLAGVAIAIAVVASPWLLSSIPADKLAAARAYQSGRQPWLAPAGVFAIPRAIDAVAIVWIVGVLIAAIVSPFVFGMERSPSPGTPGESRGEGFFERENAKRSTLNAQLSMSNTNADTVAGGTTPNVESSKFKVQSLVADQPTATPWYRERAKGIWRHLRSSRLIYPAIATAGIMLLVAWPWMLARNRAEWFTGIAAGLTLAVATRWLRPRGIPFVAAGAVGAAMLLCMSAFHGSSAWYDCGIRYGVDHWQTLIVGRADNLPAILWYHYDWSNDLNTTAVTLPAHSVFSLWSGRDLDVSEGALLRNLFLGLLVLSAIGIGGHARRRDPRLLIAIVTPWLMFFCFAPQVHERYLIFAAGISCVCAGISTGMTLLGLLLSVVSALMMLHQMLASASWTAQQAFGGDLARQFPWLFDKEAGYQLLRICNGTYPDLGFAVVLIGGVFMYFTLARRRRGSGSGLVA